MRGDIHNIQNDSSSGSSSPHSNTSHEEPTESSQDILQQKVVYNFSIPEFINHEPRIDREDRSCIESSRRKRNRTQRLQRQEPLDDDSLNESTVLIQRTKRRKRGAGVADIEREGAHDDDCHRRNVPIIDLTGVDSHDEFGNTRADSEDTNNRQRSRDRGFPYAEIFSNLERRDRHARILSRSPSLQRFQRIQQLELRRRNEAYRQSSRHIITDGPRYTEDMLLRTLPEMNTATESNDADDSVLIVNEIRGTTNNDNEDDFSIAPRMENNPSYSPPYFNSSHHSRPRLMNNSSFQLIQERFRALRQRTEFPSSPHIAMAHIQHMTHLLTRDRQRHRNQTNNNNETDVEITPQINNDTLERDDAIAARMSASQNTQNESNDGDGDTGDVEFIGEWSNNNQRHRNIHPPLVPLSLNPPSVHPLPDLSNDPAFLRFLPSTPRLHFYQENYEALLNLADTLGPAKPRGLDKAEIERIPSFRYSSNTAKETNAKCVVCISEYSNREKLRRLPCSHDFHARCIDKWLKSNKTCPVCRDEVKVTTTE